MPEDIVAHLRPTGASVAAGYQLHRVILCNYWHFGLLTLEVPHGRLFLTGDNATGKSTALVAAMLALDGDVRPHRLDTFGSAERQIAAYVLGTRGPGAASGYEHASRTSLVATEWAWQGPPDAEHPPYLTLGLTFVGNANNADPVRTWRFLLLDGARLQKDLHFLDDAGRLLDARTLRARVAAHGQVHDRVDAYKAQVAQHLFGFTDRRDMDRLIDWLLLLRKPNLTSRLSSFSEVTEFLRQALPPLPADSTLQVTQTFDHLVALRQALDERLALADAADRILQEQRAQRLALARLRAYDVRELGLSRQRAAARLHDKRQLVARLERELATAEQTLADSRTAQAELDEQIRRLEASADLRGIAAIRARLATAHADAARTEQLVDQQRALLEEAQARAAAARQARSATEARWHARVVERKVALERLRATLARLWPGALGRIDEVVTELDNALRLDVDHPPCAPARLEELLDQLRDHLDVDVAAEPIAELGSLARQALSCLAEAGIEARPLGALVTVAPDLSESQAGQIERALHAAGLLDALVVLPAGVEAATARLAAADLPAALLRGCPPRPGPPGGPLPLIVDPSVRADATWAAVAADVLASLPATLDARASAQGNWEYGVLVGRVAEGAPLGRLGASQRHARREARERYEALLRLRTDLRDVERDLLAERARLDGLHDLWLARQSAQQRQQETEGHAQVLVDALAEARRQHARAQADVELFQAQHARAHASETMRQLDRVREARRAAEETLRAADRQVGVLTSRSEDARAALAEVETTAAEADQHEQAATAALAAVLHGEPEPTLQEAARHLDQAAALGAAAVLLGGAELDRPGLERAATTARDRFMRAFAERRPVLAELQPVIEDDAVRLRCGDRLLSLSAFRPELEEEIASRRALITQEEEQLFTSFLLDGAARQIGDAIRRAEAWVDGINAVLARIPLVHERYLLELRPANDLSGPLARHAGLFRISPDALSGEQRQTLLGALREAAAEAQRRHEQDGADFIQELERLLDYRAWLRLDVAVIGASRQRVVLTDRVAKTRSGAEQMMAQYVPLFAALSALYDLAAPWAPRLLALDEAFDKASDESSQQMLRFLVGQGFQWMMTSPRLTGQGSAVPAYAEYLMVHERASRKAYGVPFFAEALADAAPAA